MSGGQSQGPCGPSGLPSVGRGGLLLEVQVQHDPGPGAALRPGGGGSRTGIPCPGPCAFWNLPSTLCLSACPAHQAPCWAVVGEAATLSAGLCLTPPPGAPLMMVAVVTASGGQGAEGPARRSAGLGICKKACGPRSHLWKGLVCGCREMSCKAVTVVGFCRQELRRGPALGASGQRAPSPELLGPEPAYVSGHVRNKGKRLASEPSWSRTRTAGPGAGRGLQTCSKLPLPFPVLENVPEREGTDDGAPKRAGVTAGWALS